MNDTRDRSVILLRDKRTCVVCKKKFYAQQDDWVFKRLRSVRAYNYMCSRSCASEYDKNNKTISREYRKLQNGYILDMMKHKESIEKQLSKATKKKDIEQLTEELAYCEYELSNRRY